jgi:hypothetical protein
MRLYAGGEARARGKRRWARGTVHGTRYTVHGARGTGHGVRGTEYGDRIMAGRVLGWAGVGVSGRRVRFWHPSWVRCGFTRSRGAHPVVGLAAMNGDATHGYVLPSRWDGGWRVHGRSGAGRIFTRTRSVFRQWEWRAEAAIPRRKRRNRRSGGSRSEATSADGIPRRFRLTRRYANLAAFRTTSCWSAAGRGGIVGLGEADLKRPAQTAYPVDSGSPAGTPTWRHLERRPVGVPPEEAESSARGKPI